MSHFDVMFKDFKNITKSNKANEKKKEAFVVIISFVQKDKNV